MPPPVVEAVRTTPLWSEYRALAHTWPREMRENARGGAWDTTPLANIKVPALLLDGDLSPDQSPTQTGRRR